MVKQQLLKDLKKVIGESGFPTDDIVCSIPQNPTFGDYSTNIALQLTKQPSAISHQSSEEIANKIISNLSDLSYLNKIEIAGGGFINFFVKPEFLAKDLEEILKNGQDFGRSDFGKGKKARVEYVSANPTGPLHFGNARGGPIGDVLASVLEFCGWQVMREYLNNDCGNQVLEFGKTLAARAGLISVPEESLVYKGEYTRDLAKKIKTSVGNVIALSEKEIIARAGRVGVKVIFDEIIQDCADMGIKFDYVVHESRLQKEAGGVLADLNKKGLLKKYEGALWFAPKSEYLKDKDAVVIKSDRSYTYFTADVVYHKEKFESGYDLVIDVFGSNTFGHVPKLKALAEAIGFDLARFKVILYQFVRIKRGQEVIRMSKRAGNFITVREVLDEVGKDALRFFILMHAAGTHMDFDLALAKERSNKNPVFYIQYAHARMSNILKKSGGTQGSQTTSGKAKLLVQKEELALIKKLSVFPDLIEETAQNYQVQGLTSYAVALADLFHRFYENCPVLQAHPQDLKQARLALVFAAKLVLVNTLTLMGIEAPERM